MKVEFSAGGVVYQKDPSTSSGQEGIKILVAKHSQHHGWVFPKGLIGDKTEGESKETTAVREVKEETGVEAVIETPLASVTYWYVFEGQRIKKTVYYFVMHATGGDITQHDFEMENVEWIRPEEVEKRLTYSSDKKVWQEARKIIFAPNT